MPLTRYNIKPVNPVKSICGLGYGYVNNTFRHLTLQTTIDDNCIIEKVVLSVSKNHKKVFIEKILIGNKILTDGVECIPIPHKSFEIPVSFNVTISAGQTFTIEFILPEIGHGVPPLKQNENIIISGYLITMRL